MKLKTILTLPGADTREKLDRIGDLLAQKAAARIPAKLRYFVLIYCGAKAIRGHEIVPDVRFMDVLKRTPRS